MKHWWAIYRFKPTIYDYPELFSTKEDAISFLQVVLQIAGQPQIQKTIKGEYILFYNHEQYIIEKVK